MYVDSEASLQKISNEDVVKLKENITLSGDFNSIDSFNGVLDGQGYTISNLHTTFINNLKEDAVVKNIQFENVILDGNSRGVFTENHGLVDSVDITNLVRSSLSENQYRSFKRTTADIDSERLSKYPGVHLIDNVCTPTELIHNSIGGLIGFNTGIVSDCEMTLFNIEYYEDDSLGGVGGLIGFSMSGKIRGCVVDSKSVENSIDKEQDFSSAICGFAVDTVLRSCKSVNFTDSGSYHPVISGIVGFGSKLTLENCKMRNWSASVEGRGGKFPGLCTLVCDSTIKNCEVTGIDLDGLRLCSMVHDNREGIIKDCSITDCSIVNFETDSVDFCFSYNGLVQGCFSENITIKCRKVNISSRNSTVVKSYSTIKVESTKEFDIHSDSTNFMVDVSIPTFENGVHVEVSESSDLKHIDENSVVEITDDIDMSENMINISVFEGVIRGNGHTLVDSSRTLFDTVNTAKIKDLTILEPKLSEPIISENIIKSSLENIEIIKENPVIEKKADTINIASEIVDSSIKSCSVNMCVDAKDVTLYGVCKYLKNSTIYNCDFTFILDKIYEFYAISSVSENTSIRNVSCKGTVESVEFASGLVWNLRSSELVNSSNSMDIIQHKKQESLSNIGGICSITTAESEIKNCDFTGSIKYTNQSGSIGGIVGDLSEGSVVKQSINKGDIYSNSNKSGGIVGRLTSGKITNCLNTGMITGEDYVGGLVGLTGKQEDANRVAPVAKTDACVVIRSKNHGDIYGDTYVGGLVGYMEDTTLENCYTYSTVKGNEYSDLTVGKYDDNSTFNNILVKRNNETIEQPNIGTVTDSTIEELSILIGV